MTVLTGRLLQQAFAESFAANYQGMGWIDPPAWDDFDPDQQDYWNKTAAWLAAELKPEVTDEMVDDAVDAWHATPGLLDDTLRAVLVAALGAEVAI